MSDRIEYDVALVGASPSNLTLAYRMVELATGPLRIAVLEKAKEVGGHLLSGAVSNPRVLKKLFPDWDNSDFPLEGICKKSYLTIVGPTGWADVPQLVMPPHFDKRGYAILNISDMAAYIAGKIAEKAGEKEGVVVDFYPGFPARSILFDGDTVIGVKVDDTGDETADNLYAKVTVFGDKGFVSRDLVGKLNLRQNPQAWAVGVKEVWETKESHEGQVWHTAGYPLEKGHLGGGFIYGCKNNKLIVGMVMALDHENPNIRPPIALQNLKKNPVIQEMIKGGKLLKYGASVLPEGGYYSLPKKFAVSGAVLVGDALGTLDVKRFSGVDKAMESGYIAAEVITGALFKGDTSEAGLAGFQEKLMNSFVGKELYDSRYFKRTFQEHPELLNNVIPTLVNHVESGRGVITASVAYGLADPIGGLKLLGAKTMMDNPSEIGPTKYNEDRTHINKSYSSVPLEPAEDYDEDTIHTAADIVFYAHTHYGEENKHIDEFDSSVCGQCVEEYEGRDTPCVGDCTAEVHQILEKEGKRTHAMALENCVQCTTCEIVCPKTNLRVNAALHGYGPDFSGM